MSEPATKEDIERVIALVQQTIARMDQRFEDLAKNVPAAEQPKLMAVKREFDTRAENCKSREDFAKVKQSVQAYTFR